ncbi:hypothetical protein QEG73_13595 [Chitinophagaceae bacterium 26-R-25]|nr:hypothetical protein [Chitinophagaceae bacterium 26-R-25]
MKCLLISALLACAVTGRSQKIDHYAKTDTMKTFDIKKFEQNKGKQGYSGSYRFKTKEGDEVKQLDFTSTDTSYKKYYQETITKEFSPFKQIYSYYENGQLWVEFKDFNNSSVEEKRYDKNGQLIKTINYDKKFQYDFEAIHKMVLEKLGVDIYDTRQAMAFRTVDNITNELPILNRYYQIHVLKSAYVRGEWLSDPDYSFFIDDATGRFFLDQKEIDSILQTNAKLASTNNKKSAGMDFVETPSSGGPLFGTTTTIVFFIVILLLIIFSAYKGCEQMSMAH